MRKTLILAAVAASAITLLSSCDNISESGELSSELTSNTTFDSFILLSANEELSDSELDDAARIFGRRADELRISYGTYVDYSSDSVRIDFKYEDYFADKLLETVTDKNIIEFRKGSDYSSSELILENDDIANAEGVIRYDELENETHSVAVELNDDAAAKFADATKELAGTDIPISIWFNGELISAPLVSTRITDGNTIITGNFDVESASELAEKIKSEPLKYDFSVTGNEFETAYK